MVDHARFTLRPRRLAVHAGTGGTARGAAEREVSAGLTRTNCSRKTPLVTPREGGNPVRRGLAAYHQRLWNTGSSGRAGRRRWGVGAAVRGGRSSAVEE